MISNAINNRYGSKKGFVNYLYHTALLILGKYNYTTKIDFSMVERFVFVCSGNICRSAMGECVMKQLGSNAASFGLDTRGGDPADPRMIAFANAHNFDLTTHITQSVSSFKSYSSDLFIGMEPSHLNQLVRYYPNSQVTALGLWLPKKIIYLHDPYAADTVYFNRCAEIIVASVTCLNVIHKQYGSK